MLNMAYDVLNNISVLVICMAAGFIASKRGIVTEKGAPVLSNILINITLPCLLVVSMQRDFDYNLFMNSIMVLFITFIIHIAGYLAGRIVCKALKADAGQETIWTFSLIFANFTYMGIPVVESIYGQDAMFYVYMACIVFNILTFTWGIRIMDTAAGNKISFKAIFLNPPVIATFTGFALFILSVKLPMPLNRSFTMMGNMTTPLSMVIIGTILAKNDLATVFKGWTSYVIIAVRLIIMPLLLYFILKLVIKDDMMIKAVVTLTGMPVAAITAIFAAQYGRDVLLASKIVFLSTVLSLITIPLMSVILSL